MDGHSPGFFMKRQNALQETPSRFLVGRVGKGKQSACSFIGIEAGGQRVPAAFQGFPAVILLPSSAFFGMIRWLLTEILSGVQ